MNSMDNHLFHMTILPYTVLVSGGSYVTCKERYEKLRKELPETEKLCFLQGKKGHDKYLALFGCRDAKIARIVEEWLADNGK